MKLLALKMFPGIALVCSSLSLFALDDAEIAGDAEIAPRVGDLDAKAKTGDGKDSLALGLRYLKGEGVERDPEEGAKWIRKSVQQQNTEAMVLLGNALCKGETWVSRDPTLGVALIKKAANLGNLDAQFLQASLYFTGENVERDWAKAAELFELVLQRCERADQHSETPPEKIRAMSDACRFFLGGAYRFGQFGLQKDFDKAGKFLRPLADSGGRVKSKQAESGTIQLVEILLTSGGKANDALAVKYLKSAAARGNAGAMRLLGCMTFIGRGVPENRELGRAWIKKASEKGDEIAGDILREGSFSLAGGKKYRFYSE